ncbi:response regulator [Gramella sp. AN32]|uniref:Response regulator n=1 Tax=Christiangramia antarctica TaxID=2058158 RepID=A0ABW5X3J5_9FLAO|nr:response regulator [Gramella sp. AN32]MCM4154936.1 response regulator [Gramella sp. AN32]
MKKKLNCILLIDDDKATNYINERVISRAKIVDKIVAVESGYKALDYLKEKDFKEYPKPEVIFIDINMPGMDGWEFLEEYGEMKEVQKGNIIIVMLTTSSNPDDLSKSATISRINGFKNKPLTAEKLDEIIDEYFPNYK